MTCRELLDFLADYLAAELPAAQRVPFDEHLAECPDCVAYLQNYRETIRLSKAALSEPPASACTDLPEDLVRAILAARGKPA